MSLHSKSNTEKGIASESLAAEYLINKGFEIRERNYRFKRGEIDIIALENNTLVFVEVKSRAVTYFGFPEEAVSNKKAALIIETAENYIYEKEWKGSIRFDIISITGKEVMHLPDAFY